MIRWVNAHEPGALPLVVVPGAPAAATPAALTAWARTRGAELGVQLRRNGALLFRGFGFSDCADFEAFVEIFSPQLSDYVGGAARRTRVHGKVFTSTDAS